MVRFTATEAQRRFESVMRDAQREPVEIVDQGGLVVVLISAEEYARLVARERRVVLAGEFDPETVSLLEGAEPPPEARKFDGEVC